MTQRVTLTVKKGVSLPELQDALAHLVAEAGCPGCGLNGFEFNFNVDPEEGWLNLRDRLDVVSKVAVVDVLEQSTLVGQAVLAGQLAQLGGLGG
ncbi:MAG: hypothetical protein IPH03_18560 [Tetrasphaera sp.]|nr:hypothetical protein [Tetrasphaera sp.]